MTRPKPTSAGENAHSWVKSDPHERSVVHTWRCEMFEHEMALAKRLQVCAQVHDTRNGCPYLKVRGSKGEFMHFVPAKGYPKQQYGHMYWGAHYGPDSFNVPFGQVHALEVRAFIRRYAQHRNMYWALNEIGLFM